LIGFGLDSDLGSLFHSSSFLNFIFFIKSLEGGRQRDSVYGFDGKRHPPTDDKLSRFGTLRVSPEIRSQVEDFLDFLISGFGYLFLYNF
jgi:hypothetical protein